MKRLVLFLIYITLISALLGCSFSPNFSTSYNGSDFSAEYIGDTLYWNGHGYHEISGAYDEGEAIAQTSDKGWDINKVEGSKSMSLS